MKTEKAEYQERVAAMDRPALVRETETQIWLSAFAFNNPRAPAHWKTSLLYAEAARRNDVSIYTAGYNAAVRSAGHEP